MCGGTDRGGGGAGAGLGRGRQRAHLVGGTRVEVFRKYLPRAYEKLEGFALLPPLAMFVSGSYFMSNIAGFGMGPLGPGCPKRSASVADVDATHR